jgi:ribosomal protein S18 acetylase RimI-like enzyme
MNLYKTNDILIKSLSETSVSDIIFAFNVSFADYFVKLQLTNEALIEKINAENIKLDYSVGAFADNKLVGFILIGIDTINGIQTAYNGGTGVITAFRGRQLTLSMYQQLNNILSGKEIKAHQLEVIENNKYAIQAYEKTGFKVKRILGCLKGIPIQKRLQTIEIKETNISACEQFVPLWEIKPSWQNELNAVKRTLQSHYIIGAYKDNVLVGYAIMHRHSFRLKQIFVHPNFRSSGIGKSLVSHFSNCDYKREISIIGVDEAKPKVINFFRSCGLDRYLGQYEMKMDV